MAQRSYTREEMEEILRRAAERTQASEDGVRHDDLIAAAREAGIDPDAVQAALDELGAEKTAEAAAERWTRDRRRGFWSHFSAYAIVMAFLASLNVLATPQVAWSLYVALGWGVFVALGARRAFLPPSDADVEKMLAREQKAAAKKARREEQRRAAEAWQRRWREIGEEARLDAERRRTRGSPLERAEKEIDRAIEEGVNALVGALTKRAAAAIEPRTDFDRYVASRKSQEPPRATSGPIVTPPPRTRVAEMEEEREEEVVRERRRKRARE